MLPPAIRAKLKPMLVMLASNVDGDREAARGAIGRVLAANNADWHDLAEILTADPSPASPQPPAPVPEPRIREHGDGRYEVPGVDLLPLLDTIRASGALDPYAADFINDMSERSTRWRIVLLSEKQLGFLTRLLNEVPQ